MRFLVAGLGAAGQRHVRNLQQLVPDAEFIAWRVRGRNIVIDHQLHTEAGVPEDAYRMTVVRTIEEGLERRPDAVIVANPISMHCETALVAVDAGASVFIEKPLSDRWDGVEELLARSAQKGVVTMVGYQTRFHPALERIKRHLDEGRLGRPVSAHLHYAEYLPAMHAYEDYRDSHAAMRRQGGGVILCLSHEIDLAVWLFDMPASVHAVGGHLSALEIDVEDTAALLLDCAWRGRRLPVSVYVDFVQRPTQRHGEIVCEHGTLRWDVLEPSVSVFDAARGAWEVETLPRFERNQPFFDEMSHFVRCLEGRESARVPAATGADTLRVALAARASVESGQSVPVAGSAREIPVRG